MVLNTKNKDLEEKAGRQQLAWNLANFLKEHKGWDVRTDIPFRMAGTTV